MGEDIYDIQQTEVFVKWLEKLRDIKARIIIADRLLRFSYGDFGDIKSVGDGMVEARIHYGAGYRLYFIKKGNLTIIMLGGRNKSSQERDIKKAKKLASYF